MQLAMVTRSREENHNQSQGCRQTDAGAQRAIDDRPSHLLTEKLKRTRVHQNAIEKEKATASSITP